MSGEPQDDPKARIRALIQQRELAEAVGFARRTLLVHPDRTDIRVLLAEALVSLGRFDDARTELVVLTREAGDQAVVHRLLGEAHLVSGQLHRAEESLRRAIELDPTDVAAKTLLASMASSDEAAAVEKWFDPEAIKTSVTALPPVDKTDATAMPEFQTTESRDPRDAWDDKTTLDKKAEETTNARKRPSVSSEPPTGQRVAPEPSNLLEAPTRAEITLPPEVPDHVAPPTAAALSGRTVNLDLDDGDVVAPPTAAALSGRTVNLDLDDSDVITNPPVAVEDPSEKILPPPTGPSPSGTPPAQPAATSEQALPKLPPPTVTFDSEPPQPAAVPPIASQQPAPQTRSAKSSPAMAAVVPATTKRRRPVPIGLVVVGFAALAAVAIVGSTVGWFVWRRHQRTALDEAALRATDYGTRTYLDDAIARAASFAGDPVVEALRARLEATLMYEHGENRRAAIEPLLEALDAEDPSARTNRHIAIAYFDLATERADDARDELDAVFAEGNDAAEAAHARAAIALALGDPTHAIAEARRAAALRPNAPRHVMLLALALARGGAPEAALHTLERVPNGGRWVSLHAARARILADMPGQEIAAAREARIVLDPEFARESSELRAWATLVLGRVAFQHGDVRGATEKARAVLRIKPTGDETLDVELGALLVACGVADEAYALVSPPVTYSTDMERRSLVLAESAEALGRTNEAQTALAAAGNGPRAQMIRAKIAEAHGSMDEALAAYGDATRDPTLAVQARIRMGAIHLAAGRPREAAEALEAARAAAPADPELVDLEVRAFVALGSLDLADRVLSDALARRPGSPDFLAARANVALARGDARQAFEALRDASHARPNDLSILSSLGEAARRVGDNAEAKRAFERVLAASPSNAAALAGLANIALSQGDLPGARNYLDRAHATGMHGGALLVVEVGLAVIAGSGEGGIADARAAVEANGTDPGLWAALGRLQLQAERDREASASFQHALELDATEPNALLGRAIIAIRTGDLAGASQRVDAASASAHAAQLGPSFAARVLVARGRLRFEIGDFSGADARAREALALDAHCGEAHLLLANVSNEQHHDPTAELRAAVDGTATPPEAVARLATKLGTGADACRFAARYLAAAPAGFDAPAVRAVAAHCQ